MQFSKIQNLDVVTRITGPTHNYLGIEFSAYSGEGNTPVLERLRTHDEPVLEIMDPHTDLCREVMDGVAIANERFGTHLGVVRIRYIGDDSKVSGVYNQLAQSLVEHFVERQRQSSFVDESSTLDDEIIDRHADELFLEYDRRESEDAARA